MAANEQQQAEQISSDPISSEQAADLTHLADVSQGEQPEPGYFMPFTKRPADAPQVADAGEGARVDPKMIPVFATKSDGTPLSADEAVALAELCSSHSPIRTPFTKLLKAARLHAQFGLREFAEHIGVSPSRFAAIQNGREEPDEAELNAIISGLRGPALAPSPAPSTEAPEPVKYPSKWYAEQPTSFGQGWAVRQDASAFVYTRRAVGMEQDDAEAYAAWLNGSEPEPVSEQEGERAKPDRKPERRTWIPYQLSATAWSDDEGGDWSVTLQSQGLSFQDADATSARLNSEHATLREQAEEIERHLELIAKQHSGMVKRDAELSSLRAQLQQAQEQGEPSDYRVGIWSLEGELREAIDTSLDYLAKGTPEDVSFAFGVLTAAASTAAPAQPEAKGTKARAAIEAGVYIEQEPPASLPGAGEAAAEVSEGSKEIPGFREAGERMRAFAAAPAPAAESGRWMIANSLVDDGFCVVLRPGYATREQAAAAVAWLECRAETKQQ